MMAAGKKFEVSALCSFMVLMFIMGVPYSAQAQCTGKLHECSGLLSRVSLIISQHMQNGTALEASCSEHRSEVTTCIEDGKSLCNAAAELSQLDMIQGSFDQLCGSEAVCRSKVAACQLIMASLANSNSEGSSADVDPAEMIEKICPVYGQISACLDDLDDDCKKQDIVKNASMMVTQGSQMCGGSSGEGSCLGMFMKCSSKIQKAMSNFSLDGDTSNPFAMMQKICPIYLEMDTCMSGMGDSCKDNPLVKNASAGMAVYSQMCAGFVGAQQCAKLRDCKALLSEISPKITQQKGNVTALQMECKPHRLEITKCADAGKNECTDDERKLLYGVKNSFEELCGPDPSSGAERYVVHTVFWALAAVMTTMTSLHLF